LFNINIRKILKETIKMIEIKNVVWNSILVLIG
jgi:hypothetical protein